MDLVAQVPSDLADLVPGYRQNRLREVLELREAVSRGDLDTVVHLGERMYAVGEPYGFGQITVLGRKIREACAAGNRQAMLSVIDQYRDYLNFVTVAVVQAPFRSSPRPR